MSNVVNNAGFRLVLQGEVRLEYQGRPVAVRKKGLALLAYLGVVGAASRARLADLLWQNGTGRANLRVELHRLADVTGRSLFEPRADPLRLPSWVTVDRDAVDDTLLEGIDGVSFDLDRWIEGVRAQAERKVLQNRRAGDLARGLAGELRSPFLIVLRARPAEDLDEFLTALSDATRLPLVEGVGGPARALRVVSPPYPDGCTEALLAAREGGWVLRVPAYGEDPREVLELRNAFDPARLRYVELPRVSWEDARQGLLHDLRFEQAAEAYVFTGGNGGFLRELARMQWVREGDGVFAVPQRVRAAYQLEMRYVSLEARLALERLSIHPGPITEALIDVLDARGALDELERRGWLTYDGAWRFREPESRTVLCRSLQPGRRGTYHREVAVLMEVEGDWLAGAYHRIAAGQPVVLTESDRGVPNGLVQAAVRAALGLEVDGASPRYLETMVGPELALLEAERHGPGTSGEGADWRMVKIPGNGPSAISFELPGKRALVHLRGRCWAEAPLGVGVAGQALPLEFELADGHRVVFVQGLTEPLAQDGEDAVLMPLSGAIDVWLLVSDAIEGRILTRAEAAVVELEITLHAVGRGGAQAANEPAQGREMRQVMAIDLSSGIGVPATEVRRPVGG